MHICKSFTRLNFTSMFTKKFTIILWYYGAFNVNYISFVVTKFHQFSCDFHLWTHTLSHPVNQKYKIESTFSLTLSLMVDISSVYCVTIFWRTHVLFVGPLIPMFWTSGWWCLPWVSKPVWISPAHFLACMQFLRFTSGATPAHLLMASMVACRVFYMHLSVEVGCQGSNGWSPIQRTDMLLTQPPCQGSLYDITDDPANHYLSNKQLDIHFPKVPYHDHILFRNGFAFYNTENSLSLTSTSV